MSTSTPQVSWDNRPVIAKRRRAELYGFLNHLNIPHPVGAPKTQMLQLLEANGIDLNAPHDYFQWQLIQGKDEQGNPHQHIEPVTELHETARIQGRGETINYDKILAERAEANAAIEAKDEQIEAQDVTLQLILDKLAALEANAVPLTSMTPPQLKGIAKRRGLDATGLKKKDELIALLEG